MNKTNNLDNVGTKEKKVGNKKPLTILPNPQQLNQVWEYINQRPNQKGEIYRLPHHCLFLLCWKAGLRVSEAISFDFNLHHTATEYQDLYLLRGKGNKDRYVYVSPEIIKELKKRTWKPNAVNRISFFEYLRVIKREISLPEKVELAPHTLRRCFATHNAINGMPLVVLQKVLGHAKISTTSLYIKDSGLESLLQYKPL